MADEILIPATSTQFVYYYVYFSGKRSLQTLMITYFSWTLKLESDGPYRDQ